MGLRIERLKKILGRIPEFTDKLSNLTNNEEFKKALDTTGTIGNLIKLSIVVVQEIKKHYTTLEKKAFSQLLEIAMDSAKEPRKSFRGYSK